MSNKAKNIKRKIPGRTIDPRGYVLIRVGKKHHLADVRGYAYEHRLVIEEKIKRRLNPGEMVHHVNHNKSDNRPENLQLVNGHAEHRFLHRSPESNRREPGEPNPHIECKCGCGIKFQRYDESGRPREFVSGHNPMPAPTSDAILEFLERGSAHRQVIARSIGKGIQPTATALSKLKGAGLVEQISHGIWRKTNGKI